jgi:hypothetical protein
MAKHSDRRRILEKAVEKAGIDYEIVAAEGRLSGMNNKDIFVFAFSIGYMRRDGYYARVTAAHEQE